MCLEQWARTELMSLTGIPVQLTTDKGTETHWLSVFQLALRCVKPLILLCLYCFQLIFPISRSFFSELDEDEFPSYVALTSTNNTVIERFWRLLKERFGDHFKHAVRLGAAQHLFNPVSVLHV